MDIYVTVIKGFDVANQYHKSLNKLIILKINYLNIELLDSEYSKLDNMM